MAVAQKLKSNIISEHTPVCVSLCYLGIIQLTLQAADLFREPKGFGVRGGQIVGDTLNLTLKMVKEGECVIL